MVSNFNPGVLGDAVHQPDSNHAVCIPVNDIDLAVAVVIGHAFRLPVCAVVCNRRPGILGGALNEPDAHHTVVIAEDDVNLSVSVEITPPPWHPRQCRNFRCKPTCLR